MIPASADFITAMSNRSPKKVYVKLEIYDKDMKFLYNITTYVSKDDIANLSVDRSRPIRRSFTFALDNSDGRFTWGQDKLLWINKRLKLYIGLKLQNSTIEYIPQGVYVLTELYDTHNLSDGKKCFITGMDKAFLFTDKRGVIQNNIIIAAGTNVGNAIKTIASEGGETLFNFDEVTTVTPYELSYDPGTNRWDIMQELADFAYCDLSYDVHGFLRLKYLGELNDFYNLPETWTYEYGGTNANMYAGNIRKMDEEKLCNAVRVSGGSGQTAVVTYDLIVDEANPIWVGCMYSVQQLGYIWYGHNDFNPDPIIETQADAKNRAKYILMRRLGYLERVSLSISWNVLHEPTDIIKIIDNENSVSDRYMIESFNLPLIPDMVQMECYKENRIINDWNFL